MLKINIPGREELTLSHLILDYNGTIAEDGEIIESIRPRLAELAKDLSICVITADTHGTAAKKCEGLPLEVLTFPTTDEVGGRLLMVLGPDGQAVLEPVLLGMRDRYYEPDATGFVVESFTADGTAGYRHYDYTGTVTVYENVTSFQGFFEGLAVVTLLGDTQHHYYINHHADIVLR